jgi:hypothetical protein
VHLLIEKLIIVIVDLFKFYFLKLSEL